MKMKLRYLIPFLAFLLFTYRLADAAKLSDNINPHIWITDGEQSTPLAQISMAYKLDDAEKICLATAQALSYPGVIYLCVSNTEHWKAMVDKYGK